MDGKLNEYRLFRMFRRFDLRINFIPQADVLQEIRAAMIASAKCQVNGKVETVYTQDTVRGAMKAIHRLLFDYGYSRNPRNAKPLRRGGKEFRFAVDACGNEYAVADPHCICGYGSVMPELCECGMDEKSFALAKEILDFYETHSAEETCAHFGVKRTRKIEKALMSAMPKQAGAGKGGKRENAGRKKKLIWNAETF